MSMPAETLNPGMTLAELLVGVDGLPETGWRFVNWEWPSACMRWKEWTGW